MEQEQDSQESPHGPVAAKLGIAAARAVDALVQVPAWLPDWNNGLRHPWLLSDQVSFGETAGFLFEAHEAQGTLDIGEGAVDPRDELPLSMHLDNAHTALPITEGERVWLVHRFYDTGAPVSEAARLAREAENNIVMEAGQWRRVGGQDLLDRWWAWRRNLAEYSNCGSFFVACKALYAIAEIAAPDFEPSHAAQQVVDTSYAELNRAQRSERDIADRL